MNRTANDARRLGMPKLAAYREKIALVCMECEKTFRVRPGCVDPRCPKCGSVDYEVK